jgi:hypothetical protein
MKEVVITVLCCILLIFGVYSCSTSEWYKEDQRKQEVEEKAQQTPHIIRRSDDGCAVYAFKTGDTYHYFTRCAATTVTERNYTEQQGKHTINKTEEISTENK